MPWEFIGGGMLVFPQMKVNSSSVSRSQRMPGHFGFGLMAPASRGCLSQFHIPGAPSSNTIRAALTLGGFLQLAAAFASSLPVLWKLTVGGSSLLCMSPSHCFRTMGGHPRSQIPVPFWPPCLEVRFLITSHLAHLLIPQKLFIAHNPFKDS